MIKTYIRRADGAIVRAVQHTGHNLDEIAELDRIGFLLKYVQKSVPLGCYIVVEGDNSYDRCFAFSPCDFFKVYGKIECTIIPKNSDNSAEVELTANDYQREALRTESGMSKEYPRLLNGLMGLNGEAGECIDILKKHYFQGHELDKEHLAKELGDVAWYLAVSADALGYDLNTILKMNVDKLRARYPDGFDAEHSVNRQKNDI